MRSPAVLVNFAIVAKIQSGGLYAFTDRDAFDADQERRRPLE